MKKLAYLFIFGILLLPGCTTNEVASPVDKTSFNPGLSPGDEGWSTVKDKVESQTGEVVQSTHFPLSNTEADHVYLTTSGGYTGMYPEGKQVNNVYKYQLDSEVLELVYDEEENRSLMTLGMRGADLILVGSPIDYSPGPCTNLWQAGGNEFPVVHLSLNIDAPETLDEYVLPTDLIEMGLEQQVSCEENFS